MSRKDQYNATVSITLRGTTRDFGTFDKMSGGDVDSSETKFNPGGMKTTRSLGGRITVGNVTVERLYDAVGDHPQMGWLIGAVGKASVVVTKTLLDVDGNASGSPLVYKGSLKQVSFPDHDSESSDVGMFTLEISSATVVQ